jgi:hypothetical protein
VEDVSGEKESSVDRNTTSDFTVDLEGDARACYIACQYSPVDLPVMLRRSYANQIGIIAIVVDDTGVVAGREQRIQ